DLREGRVDEVLMSEARVDGHDQDLLHVHEYLFQHGGWRRGIDDHARAFAERFDALYRAMQVGVAFPVDEEGIGSGLGEGLEKRIWVRHHQMRLEGKTRHRPQRLHDGWPHRQVRYEVPVHNIHVDAIGPGP